MKKILVLNFSILTILITVGCRQSIEKEIQDLKNKFTVGLNKINEHQIIPDSTNSNSLTNSNPTNVVNANTLLDNNKDEQTKRIALENEFEVKISERSYIGQFLLNSNDESSKAAMRIDLQTISDLIQDIHDQNNDDILETLIGIIIEYHSYFTFFGSSADKDVSILRDFFSQMQKEHRTKLIEILLWEHVISAMFRAAEAFRINLLRSRNPNFDNDNGFKTDSDRHLTPDDFYVNGKLIVRYIDDAYEMVVEKFNNKDNVLECADVLITESKRIYKFLEDSFSWN